MRAELPMATRLTTTELLAGLRAAGESTRLRLLALLSSGELNVKDLTRILGQSQPRISRHLKLLGDAGLIERFREGSWVYFRLSDETGVARVVRALLTSLDPQDPVLARDRLRADAVKRDRAALAQAYFRSHAAEWDEIRALHVAEDDVENAMIDGLGAGPFDLLVDIGTGTGRILELFSDRFKRGYGFDINHDMLAFARAKLEKAGLKHCQVRHGDLFHLPFDMAEADAVVVHQVLHFLDDPLRALKETARILKPGGRLLVVDFAPHDLEYLRDEFAHQRLGFDGDQIERWMARSGLHLLSRQDLKPRGKGRKDKDRLTVSVWVAARPAASRERSGKPDTAKLEATI